MADQAAEKLEDGFIAAGALEAAGHEASEDLIDQAVEKLEDVFIPDTDDVLEAAGHEVSEDLVAEKLEDGLTANTDDLQIYNILHS